MLGKSPPAAATVVTAKGENKTQEDAQKCKDTSETDGDDGAPTLKRQGTLRRKFNIHRGKQQGIMAIYLYCPLLCTRVILIAIIIIIITDKSPEPQVRSIDELRQENIDLKREVMLNY